jgi:SAM-dependent methyltransferase
METVRKAVAVALDSDGYLAAHRAFRKCSNQQVQILEWVDRSGLLDLAGGSPSVLGVGSGRGDVDLEMIRRLHDQGGVAYDAIDPSRAALEQFSERCHEQLPSGAAARVWFQQSNFEDFEPGRRYDVIHFIHTMYSISDIGTAAAKGYRLLEDDGRLVIICSTDEGINRFKAEVVERLGLPCRTTLPEAQLLVALSELQGSGLQLEIVPSSVSVESCLQQSEEGEQVMSFLLQTDFAKMPAGAQAEVLDVLASHCDEIDGVRSLSQPMLALEVTKQVPNATRQVSFNVRDPHRSLGSLAEVACSS